jgi:hypothetical protein
MENDRLYREPGAVDEVKAHTYAGLYHKKKRQGATGRPPMIANDALAALRTKYHTTELHGQREYMQQLFQSYLYQQPHTNKMYFKGGTALRIVYGSPRFSEDLDFGLALHDVDEIETAVLHTLVEIEREGITTRIVDSVKTSGGYLAVIAFIFGSTPVQIRLEASFREKELRCEQEVLPLIGQT